MELSHTHHVLLFPFPAKGHIKPFFSLAQLLCNVGVRVTFLNTDHHHRRIHDLNRLAAQLPTLHFDSVSDGLPPDEPRDVPNRKLCESIRQVTSSLFRELLVSYNDGTSSGRPPITCVITDVVFRFPIDIAEELGIPVFTFSTFSARFLFLIFWIPKLLEDGQLRYPEQELHGVPGAEGLIRWKDLPGFWSVEDVADWDPMNFVNQTLATSRSSGLILNTFDELEAPFLTSLSKIYKKIYSLGPINSLLKNIQSQPQYNLWKEDHSCMAWLDSQPRKSVVFVWRIGLQLEDGFDSSTIETMVRSVMDQTMEKTVAELAERAKNRARTSLCHFQRIVLLLLFNAPLAADLKHAAVLHLHFDFLLLQPRQIGLENVGT
ncbi:7-deoxyloganetin glucosyltransferase, partial [Cucurbita argyrosperma subsp. sororia]